MSDSPYMVEQVIKYSDGTETVIKYRGVVENGVLLNESPEVEEEEVVVVEPKKNVLGLVQRKSNY